MSVWHRCATPIKPLAVGSEKTHKGPLGGIDPLGVRSPLGGVLLPLFEDRVEDLLGELLPEVAEVGVVGIESGDVER